jgi:hypothetical protein
LNWRGSICVFFFNIAKREDYFYQVVASYRALATRDQRRMLSVYVAFESSISAIVCLWVWNGSGVASSRSKRLQSILVLE